MERYLKGALCVLGLACGTAWTAERVDSSPVSADDYFRAIRANDLKTLRQLVASGSVNIHDKLDTTPLHYAALYGNADAVSLLLKAGADPNARTNAANTPLIFAACN